MWPFGNKTEPARRVRAEEVALGTSFEDVYVGGTRSAADIAVTSDSAIRCSTVYACIRLYAETIAALPIGIYKKSDKGIEKANDHPLYPVLAEEANTFMSAFTLKEVAIWHVLLTGNFYQFPIWKGGRLVSMIPLLPEQVEVSKGESGLVYKIRLESGKEILANPQDVIHVPGPGFNGITGFTPIRLAREAIGLALATERHGSELFKNGANLSGVIKTPAVLTETQVGQVAESFKKKFAGAKNSHSVAVLGGGSEWQQVGMNNEDAQFLETRKFQVAEIARIYNTPPHMIGDLERATNNNIEHQSIDFVRFKLLPWLRRIELEYNRKLFRGTDYYCRFNVDGLLRGDFASRMEGHSKALNAGFVTANEVRAMEELGPRDGADDLRVPLNTAPAGKEKDVSSLIRNRAASPRKKQKLV